MLSHPLPQPAAGLAVPNRAPTTACYSSWMSGWLSKLARPLVVKGGPVLLTLSDVRAFMLDRLPEWHHRRSRQLTAELLLTAAKDPGEIEACTQQIEWAPVPSGELGAARGLGRRKPVGCSWLGGRARAATECRQTRLSIPLS